MKKLLFLGLVFILAAGCTIIGDPEPEQLGPESTTIDSTQSWVERRPTKFGRAINEAATQCQEMATDLAGGHIPGSGLLEARTQYFPNQVRSVEEIVVWELYASCNLRDGEIGVYLILSEPYEVEMRGYKSLAVNVFNVEYGSVERFFLADRAVVPYESGKWNVVNVLLLLFWWS